MGNANATIIKENLTLAEVYKCVQIAADDTDIFICLLFPLTQDADIIMRTKIDCINFRKVQESLGKCLIDCLFFIHSISGCDTTSSLYSIGKLKVVKLLSKSEALQQRFQVLCEAGEQFVLFIYQGGVFSSIAWGN